MIGGPEQAGKEFRLERTSPFTPRERIAWFVYSAAGSGEAPIAPGTAGTALAALLILLPGRIAALPPWENPLWAAAVLVVFFAGVRATASAEARYGRDPGIVVIDEVAGMMVTLFLVPNTVIAVLLGFFLFRAFDIVKPWPVRLAEKPRGGWGVMLDDVAAGVYANLALRLLLFLIGRSS